MDADEHARRTLTALCAAARISMPEVVLGDEDAPAVQIVSRQRQPAVLVLGPRLLDALPSWREAVLARAVAELGADGSFSTGPVGRAVPYRQFVKA